MRQCLRCQEKLADSDFNYRNKRLKTLQPFCKSCQSDAAKESYARKKQQYKDKAKERQVVQAAIFHAWKQNLVCSACYESHSWCIDFHHTDPSTKDGTISSFSKRVGSKKLKEEIVKCVVLCSNCHRKHHAGDLPITHELVTFSKKMIDTLFE